MISLIHVLIAILVTIGCLMVMWSDIFARQDTSRLTWILWIFLYAFLVREGLHRGDDIAFVTFSFFGALVSAAMLSFTAFFRGSIRWGRIETFTLLFVMVCACFMMGTHDQVIWSGAVALLAAGIPWFWVLWKASFVDFHTKVATVAFLGAAFLALTTDHLANRSTVISTSLVIFWIFGVYIAFAPRKKSVIA